jgi:uncharacterized membrane protein HdeD (DUF308 family)
MEDNMRRRTKNEIEKNFKKIINLNIVVEVVIIVFALILIIFPDISNKLIGIIVGSLLLFYAANLAMNYFNRDGAKIYSLSLSLAIIIGLIGLFLIFYPYSIMKFVTIALGLFFIISGANKVNNALWLKKGNEMSWTITLAMAITILILGLILLFNPFSHLTVTRVVGIFLILSSILRISDAILFKKRKDDIIDIFW